MYRQPTEEDYDLALLLAKRDLATSGATELSQDTEVDEFFTKETFFKDLQKVSHKIKPKPTSKS